MIACFGRRGVAQPGSAPAWGAGGRRFESSRPDQKSLVNQALTEQARPKQSGFFCALWERIPTQFPFFAAFC